MANPDSIRLHGTETRIPIAAKFPVAYNVLDKKGRIVGVVRYMVTLVRNG